MDFRKIFILFLFFIVVLSINTTVANDNTNLNLSFTEDSSSEVISVDNSVELTVNDDLENSINSYDNNIGGKISDSAVPKEIYVGHNNKTEFGEGSFDNPFSNFKSACDSVNGEDNVTIYVFEGKYYLGENLNSGESLKFNTKNLNIIGNGTVEITYLYNTKPTKTGDPFYAETFSLTSSDANLNMFNIIFNSTDCVRYITKRGNNLDCFMPFYGQANSITFNNCSFLGLSDSVCGVSYEADFNSKFISCYFEGKDGDIYEEIYEGGTHVFEKCVFNVENIYLALYYYRYSPLFDISLVDVCFDKSTLPSWLKPTKSQIEPSSAYGYVIPVTRYANFTVTQTYLGNDEYMISGKLTWNGTEDQDGMEKFQPMTVILESEYGGEFASEVKLINGTFETIYKNSDSNHHKITVSLHNTDIPLEFYTVNITAKETSIYYGDDQNIKVNLSQAINNNVTIVVSNATDKLYSYIVQVNSTDSFNFTIPDRLKEGKYNINLTLNENNLYGIGTTTLTVSKISNYDFVVVPDSNVKVGDTVTINITLPSDVNGTVTVQFGNKTQSLPAETQMAFNFTALKATTYFINVTYSGNDKYTPKNHPDSVAVDKADSSFEINDAVFNYGEQITIPFTVTNANGVTVNVYNEDGDEVANTSSNTNIITLNALSAGEYTLYVMTVVDTDNYNWVDNSDNLTKLIINKANSSLIISDKEFTYATEAIINAVTVNSTGNVIATLTDENNKEIAVTVSGDNITLPLLNVGKYTLTVTTNVDANHTNVTKSATVTIVKATPSISVVVSPDGEIFEGNEVTININLSGNPTGIVLVDANNDKLFGELNNSAVKLALNNLVAGEYNIKVNYLGDNNYNTANQTVPIKVNAKEDSNVNITIPTDIKIDGDKSVNIDLPKDANGTVTLTIDGKVVSTVPVVNGSAKVSLDNLTAGNHVVEIAYSGDNKYAPASSTKIVTVEKQNVVIVVDKTFTRAAVDTGAGEKGGMFYAILKDAKGNILVNKTVQIAYNGVIYNKITDSQGRAGLQINLAKAGTYPITLSFAGDDTYNASPLTLSKLTVTKKKTTIKASNKSFKAKKKSKKISVTLKTVKNQYDKKTYLKSGKKVTLKVKGKTYTAKINKKGVAKFTIKLTKKGKYTAKIKFAGDNTYKASSKTIKIRIK